MILSFIKKNKKKIISILCVMFVLSFCIVSASSQSSGFPDGSTRGRTEMSEGSTGIDFPNITFSATAPRTGQEVAFSVQLLLILTLLSLAPSILILITCFMQLFKKNND